MAFWPSVTARHFGKQGHALPTSSAPADTRRSSPIAPTTAISGYQRLTISARPGGPGNGLRPTDAVSGDLPRSPAPAVAAQHLVGRGASPAMKQPIMPPGQRRSLSSLVGPHPTTAARHERHTILFATDDLDEATGTCDQVTSLDGGRVLAATSAGILRRLISRRRRIEADAVPRDLVETAAPGARG
jgi:hypothetical protein